MTTPTSLEDLRPAEEVARVMVMDPQFGHGPGGFGHNVRIVAPDGCLTASFGEDRELRAQGFVDGLRRIVVDLITRERQAAFEAGRRSIDADLKDAICRLNDGYGDLLGAMCGEPEVRASARAEIEDRWPILVRGVSRLRADVERMRPVVEAAECLVDSNPCIGLGELRGTVNALRSGAPPREPPSDGPCGVRIEYRRRG